MAVHGHRGARARRPENTIEAFEYAIGVGADALELDIQVTRDGLMVVSHDPVADVREGIPLLEEVFRLAQPTTVELNLEVKPPARECTGRLVQMIREYGMDSRAMVQSFDFQVLRAMKELAPEIRRGALFEEDPREFTEIASGVHYVAPEYRLVTSEKVARAHAAGMQVIPWTVNAPDDWARMVDAGVDGIISDDPAALIAYLRGRGLR